MWNVLVFSILYAYMLCVNGSRQRRKNQEQKNLNKIKNMRDQAVSYEISDKSMENDHADQDIVFVIVVYGNMHESKLRSGSKGHELGASKYTQLHQHNHNNA